MFCFPHAGAGASIFAEWQRAFPDAIEIVPVQLPGREDRIGEPAFRRLAPLLDSLSAEIKPYLDIPFAFFGHSLGALIAFDLARRVQHERLVHFIPSGSRAPGLPRRLPDIHHFPPREFVRQLQRHYNTLSPQIVREPELLELVLPAIQADFAIFETAEYHSAPPLACPISAFGGDADRLVAVSDLESWQMETIGAFTTTLFSGGHFYLKTAQRDVWARLNGILGAHLV
jgi:medium-chain acyl-[acyl-carrier-protein] hydrolase